MSRMCITPKIWSFHGVIDAEFCLLFAPVVSSSSLWSEHFQELHWCSLELSRRRKSFYISILLLFYCLRSHLAQQGTIPCIPWTLPNSPKRAGHTQSEQQEPPRAGESITVMGKAKPGKNKARIMLGLVNFWIPLPKEVPWHCSNSPGSSIALLRHRGFNPENVQVPITPKKGFSCYFMAGKTLFERIFLEI